MICEVIGCTLYSIQETAYSPGLVVAAKNGERFVCVANRAVQITSKITS